MPAAYVAIRDGASLDGDELIVFCRERLAATRFRRHVRIVPALPRNPSGKVLKRELRGWEAL